MLKHYLKSFLWILLFCAFTLAGLRLSIHAYGFVFNGIGWIVGTVTFIGIRLLVAPWIFKNADKEQVWELVTNYITQDLPANYQWLKKLLREGHPGLGCLFELGVGSLLITIVGDKEFTTVWRMAYLWVGFMCFWFGIRQLLAIPWFDP